jgi:glucose uptake protein GlcU
MVTKRQVDRVGGVGSILVGIMCAWIAYQDWQKQHSVWKAFAVICVVLVLNGIAMIRYSMRKGPDREDETEAPNGIITRSSRV